MAPREPSPLNHQPVVGPEEPPPNGPDPAPAAGWYDDPDAPGVRRYWDGTVWTDSRVTTEGIPYQGQAARGRKPVWPAAVLLILGGIGIWFAQTYKPSAANELGLNGNSFVLKPGPYHVIMVASIILLVIGGIRLLAAISR